MPTQNNEILDRILGNPSSEPTETPASPSIAQPGEQSLLFVPVQEEELVSQTRVVTVRYKVYSVILLLVGLYLFMTMLPNISAQKAHARNSYNNAKTQYQSAQSTKAAFQRSETFLREIEANQSKLKTCLNKEDGAACSSLPNARNMEHKGKTIKDLSIPLSFLQLNSLYNPKMPVDEKKVLRNLNEYLIRDGIMGGTAIRNGEIDKIAIGEVKAVNSSEVFFSVPLELSIRFERVGDLKTFVRNVEKKLIENPDDRILYKIQEVGYDIVASNQPQVTNILMMAYYYHDPRFEHVVPSQESEELSPAEAVELTEPEIDRIGSCQQLPTHISNCTSHRCQYGKDLIREVNGLENGKCNFQEQISPTELMSCLYTETQRKVIAQHYKELFEDNNQDSLQSLTQQFIANGSCSIKSTAIDTCNDFPKHLDSCTPYSCTFEHPFVGGTMKRTIEGIVAGKCKYVEDMPNNGKMTCNYTESQRKVASKFYKETLFGSDMDNKNTTNNPLQQFMDQGICVISGY